MSSPPQMRRGGALAPGWCREASKRTGGADGLAVKGILKNGYCRKGLVPHAAIGTGGHEVGVIGVIRTPQWSH